MDQFSRDIYFRLKRLIILSCGIRFLRWIQSYIAATEEHGCQ
jgi:hypothetical protein